MPPVEPTPALLELQRLLQGGDRPPDEGERRRSDCFYLGGVVFTPCNCPRRHIRKCDHPAHVSTTLNDCETCPDWEEV